MRKLLFVLALVALGLNVSAQKKKGTLGLHFFLTDFGTGRAIKDSGFSKAFDGSDWRKVKKMNPGIAISYDKGITDHIDWSLVGSLSFVDYPIANRVAFGENSPWWTVDMNAHVKLFTDKAVVNPYLNVGLGGSITRGFIGAYAPLGLGLQFNLNNSAFVYLNTQYRLGLTDNATEHLFHSIGVAGNVSREKAAPPVKEIVPPIAPPPPPPPAPKDSDNDGIIDDNDRCPNVAGIAKYNGCPIPDTDSDGINDENDKCPNQAGVARYNGCPIPDGDGDGINDEEDKCPTIAGIAANQGCPEVKQEVVDRVNYAAKNIFYATGSAKLLAKSYKALNEVAKILGENPDLKLDISGHTDNTGVASKNQALSEQRATSVMEYLKSKGVDESHMSAAGYGSDQPLADNKTAAGRAKNRRVELKLSY